MTYDVKIIATVTKTIRVEADDEKTAIDEAHQAFTVAVEDDGEEDYNEETVSCTKVEPITCAENCPHLMSWQEHGEWFFDCKLGLMSESRSSNQAFHDDKCNKVVDIFRTM